jgi:hypothetical protein
LLVVPEILDILNRSPLVLTEGLTLVEKNLKKPADDNPNSGLRRTIIVATALLGSTILFASGAPWYVWAALGLVALIALWRA